MDDLVLVEVSETSQELLCVVDDDGLFKGTVLI